VATTNITVTDTWAEIVPAGDNFFLTVPHRKNRMIEVAVTEGSAPTVTRGHRLVGEQREGLNRALVGPGAVYARCKGNDIAVALTLWTPE